MSSPSPNNAEIANLSDDYIKDLKAENQRYDITLASDFVISVLPNGIKTWAFIYDFQGRHRRKTLGVFPDMNFSEAKASLKKSRTEIVRMDEPTVSPNEFGRRPAVLGGGHYVPKERRKSKRWGKFWSVLGALALLGAVSGLGYVWKNRTIINLPTPAVKKNDAPFKIKPASAPSDPSQNKPKPRAKPAIDDKPKTLAKPPPERPRSEATTTDTAGAGRAAAPVSVQKVSQLSVQPTSPARTEKANVTPQVKTPDFAPAAGATARGGSVARSTLTSAVVNLEPKDRIGPEISHKNSGFTRVFYFTELREFSDGNVVHRWELNGRTMEEVKLKVKKSWRWRTYSNKDITPGLTGQWTVSTIDASGTVLDKESFTYGY